MNDLTIGKLLDQFCAWHCTGKKADVDNPFEPTEVCVNGEVVWSDENDKVNLNLCEYCQVKNFLEFMKR